MAHLTHPTHEVLQTRVRRSHRQGARRSFWLLVLVAALAAGALSSALGAAPSPLTGLRVAASGVVLLGALGLAARVMFALETARRRATSHTATRMPAGNPSRT